MTTKQQQLYAHIVQFEAENGKYPRIVDLVNELGGDLESIRQMVKRMASNGFVEIIHHKEPKVKYISVKRIHANENKNHQS